MTEYEDIDEQRTKIIEGTKEIVSQLRDRQKDYGDLDMAQLERDRVVIKKGAWYLVPDMNKVPDSFKFLIQEIKQDSRENGILVKISNKKDPFSKFIKQFEKLGF